MRIRIVPRPFWVVALMLAASLCVGGSVGAQTYTWTASPGSGIPSVNVTYENSAGTGTQTDNGVPAESFYLTSGSTNLYSFCVNLWHSQSNSSFSTISNLSVTSANSTAIANLFVQPAFTGSALVNALNYVGSLYTSGGVSLTNGDQVGAVQLVLWAIADGGAPSGHFSYSSFSDTKLNADYNELATKLGLSSSLLFNNSGTTAASQNNFGSGVTGAAAFVSTTTYSPTGTVINVNNGPTSNTTYDQNVITWGATPQVSGTPEPSSFAIAGVGALAFVGYGLRRHKATRKASPVAEPEPQASECEGDAASQVNP